MTYIGLEKNFSSEPTIGYRAYGLTKKYNFSSKPDQFLTWGRGHMQLEV